MRFRLALMFSVFALAACTDSGVAPRQPLRTAPTLQLSHLGEDPVSADLCGGRSPCDAFDYRGDNSIGAPGICFLPPTVSNHVSDPACAARNLPGLDGIFSLAWCRVIYDDPTGETPPRVAMRPGPGDTEVEDCQDPDDWEPLVESSGQYTASVRWRRSQASVGDVFRVYVVRGDQMFAHRDVVIDPNLTTPADGYVHAIGFGNEPMKVRINEDFSCIRYDTQAAGTLNAATCLVAGGSEIEFEAGGLNVNWTFREGTTPFLADFEVSECLSLGFSDDPVLGVTGNALVDTPLADCMLSLSSEEIEVLDPPALLYVTLTDERWSDEVGSEGPFANARFNVIEADEAGVGVLPPEGDPGWFGDATFESAALRWLAEGVDRLASLVLPEPVYAAFSRSGLGTNVSRMSDLQISVMGVMAAASAGTPCASGEAHCLDLGSFGSGGSAPVSVQVSAPTRDDATSYPDDHIDVPDTRLHFFPESGSVSCPSGSAQDAFGRGCVGAGAPDLSTTPPSYWDHVVVVTGTDGLGSVDWDLAGGENELHVAACGVARMGPNEPDPLGEPGGDGVWGDLGDCSDRAAAITQGTAYDNGPADGFTPFEPVDTENEAAIYGLPLTFVARTCPQIVVDGMKGASEWTACADATVFTAPQKGPKISDNATLYTYSDGAALYIGLEVATRDLGNKIFINLTDAVSDGDGDEAAGDDLLVIEELGGVAGGLFADWHYTQSCVENSSSSLCGDPDARDDGTAAADGEARVDGAGAGTVFYEFVRPLGSPNSGAGTGKEDLGASTGQQIGLRVQVTQGQGGGKGGFVYPDLQTGTTKYHVLTLN